MVGWRKFDGPMPLDVVKQLDAEGQLFTRSLISPARKDTIRIPRYGAVAVRFIADNPGKSSILP